VIRLHALIDRISRWFALAGGIVILAATGIICIEIAVRQILNRSFVGVDELSGYALAVGTAWAFAHALVAKAHVRIDTLYSLLPRRLQPALDFGALAVLFGFVGMLVYRCVEIAYLAFIFDAHAMTPLQTPLWVPQGLWALGLIFFLLVILLLLFMSIHALVTGQTAIVAKIAGPVSVQEELADELGDLARRRGAENP
jgi:TRAP-type mannitol/chloroaromatic compound transport system permease small subunit